MSTVLTVAGEKNVGQVVNAPYVTLFDDGEVPIWENGYSWTYAGRLNVVHESITLNILLTEASFCVVDDSGDKYEVAFGGDVEGELAVVDPLIGIDADEITGSLFLSQSKLGVEVIELAMTGTVVIEEFPTPVSADVEITLTYQDSHDLVDFPISVGKTWAIPSKPISVDILITIFGYIERPFHLSVNSMEWTAECISKENITVGSHIYEVYNITYEEGLWTYYAPSVGNIVKVKPHDEEAIDFSLEMIATSYPGPDNPEKPEKPTGPTSGKIGQPYEYTTRAVDPNDDQIMFVWDFTGDLVPDSWTAFYDSGTNCTTTYTYTDRGERLIRVKARNTLDLESAWSDPLSVTIPRDKKFNNPQLHFVQSHPNLFPLLQKLLQGFGL
jgi:hypothetical protein